MKKVRFSRKRKAVTGVPKCSVLSTQYVYVGTDRISTCQIERPAALRFLHCFSLLRNGTNHFADQALRPAPYQAVSGQVLLARAYIYHALHSCQ